MLKFSKYDAARLEQAAAWLALAIVAISVWWFNTVHLAVKLAWNGESPTLLATAYLHPDWFLHDYASSPVDLLKSAPMMVYLVADRLDLSALATMKAMIALEIGLLIGASIWAGRRIWPQASRSSIVLIALLVIAGTLRMADLARFADPVYGWVYSYAYAAILVGIAAALERRVILSAFVFALTFAIHPVLGLLGSTFGVTVLLMDWRRLDLRHVLYASLLFTVIAGGWFVFAALSSSLGGNGIPDASFVAFTRIESAHWYPIDFGLFWERNYERLIPFLSETLLLLVYLFRPGWGSCHRNVQMAAGFVVLLVLTIAGICISAWVLDPFLIKLALQRASSIYLLMATFYVVPGLWQDATHASRWRATVAALTLISFFVSPIGAPFILGLALAITAIVDDLCNRGWTVRACLLLVTSSTLVVLLLVYTFAGVAGWALQMHWALSHLSRARLGMILALVVFVAVARKRPSLVAIGLLAAVAMFGMLWARSTDTFTRQPKLLAQANDYMATQLWSEKNTPVGSLFMPDPTHYYGWREFSLRPSFGSLHEWLYAGWLYNSRKDIFDEGIARLRAVGIDPNRYLKMHVERQHDLHDLMMDDLRKRYYSLSGNDLAELSRKFGISYFVFDRSLEHTAPQGCPVVYANKHYLIVRAPNHP